MEARLEWRNRGPIFMLFGFTMGFHGNKKQDGLILKTQELLILVTNEHDFGWGSLIRCPWH